MSGESPAKVTGRVLWLLVAAATVMMLVASASIRSFSSTVGVFGTGCVLVIFPVGPGATEPADH